MINSFVNDFKYVHYEHIHFVCFLNNQYLISLKISFLKHFVTQEYDVLLLLNMDTQYYQPFVKFID